MQIELKESIFLKNKEWAYLRGTQILKISEREEPEEKNWGRRKPKGEWKIFKIKGETQLFKLNLGIKKGKNSYKNLHAEAKDPSSLDMYCAYNT